MTLCFVFWFSCVRKQYRIRRTTNFFKISFRTFFFQSIQKRPRDWIMFGFEAPSLLCFLKNVSFVHSVIHVRNIEKSMGRHFGPTWRVEICHFQSRTRGVAVIKYFQTKIFQAKFWLNSAYNEIFPVQIRLVQSRQQHFKIESVTSERPVFKYSCWLIEIQETKRTHSHFSTDPASNVWETRTLSQYRFDPASNVWETRTLSYRFPKLPFQAHCVHRYTNRSPPSCPPILPWLHGVHSRIAAFASKTQRSVLFFKVVSLPDCSWIRNFAPPWATKSRSKSKWQKNSTELSRVIQKRWKIIRFFGGFRNKDGFFEMHPSEPAVIVKYRVEAVVVRPDGTEVARGKKGATKL